MEGGTGDMQTSDNGVERLMDEFLKSKGFYRKKIAKDGSCLFRAVAEQVLRCQSRHTEVRATCVDYLKKNRVKYESFIEGNFEEYLQQLEDPQNWVGEVEISALAVIYRHDFIIFQEPGKPPVNITENSFSDKVRLCFLNGNHYDSVYPREFVNKAALCQSILYELLYEKVYGVDRDVVLAGFRGGKDGRDDGHGECKSSDESDLEEEDDFWPNDAVVPTNMNNQRSSNNDQHSKTAKSHQSRSTLSQRVQRSLNPTLFRNVEYDVWLRSQRAQQKRDFCIAAGMQYTVGDKCKVRLDNTGRFYSAYIQAVDPDNGPVTVFIEELGKKHSIPLWNLRPTSSADGESWSTVAEKGKRLSLVNGNGQHSGKAPRPSDLPPPRSRATSTPVQGTPPERDGRGGRKPGKSSPTLQGPLARVHKQNSWPSQATVEELAADGSTRAAARSPDWKNGCIQQPRPQSDVSLKSQKPNSTKGPSRKGELGAPSGPPQEPHFGLSPDERLARAEEQKSQALLEIMQRDERSFPALGSQGSSRAANQANDAGRRTTPQAGERRGSRRKGDPQEQFQDGDNSVRPAQREEKNKLLTSAQPGCSSGAQSAPPHSSEPRTPVTVTSAAAPPPAVTAPVLATSTPLAAPASAPATSAPPPAVTAPGPAISTPLVASAPAPATSAVTAPGPATSAPLAVSAPSPVVNAPPPAVTDPTPASSAPSPPVSAPPPVESAPVAAPCTPTPPPPASMQSSASVAPPTHVPPPSSTSAAPSTPSVLPAPPPVVPNPPQQQWDPAPLTGFPPGTPPVEPSHYNGASPYPPGVMSQLGIAPGPPPTPPMLPEHLSHPHPHAHSPSLPPHGHSPSLPPHGHSPSLPPHGHSPSLPPHAPLSFHQMAQLYQDPLYPGFPVNDKEEMVNVPPYCYMPNGQDLPREIGILRFFFNLGVKAYSHPAWPPHSYLYQLQQAHMTCSMQPKVSFLTSWYPEGPPPGPFRMSPMPTGSMPMPEGYGPPPSYGHGPTGGRGPAQFERAHCPVQPGVGMAMALGPQHTDLGLGSDGRPPLGYSPQPAAPLPPHLGGLPWPGPRPNAYPGAYSTPPPPPHAQYLPSGPQYPAVTLGYHVSRLSAGAPAPAAVPHVSASDGPPGRAVSHPPAEGPPAPAPERGRGQEPQSVPLSTVPPPPPPVSLPAQLGPPREARTLTGGGKAGHVRSTPEPPRPLAGLPLPAMKVCVRDDRRSVVVDQGPAGENRGDIAVPVAGGGAPREGPMQMGEPQAYGAPHSSSEVWEEEGEPGEEALQSGRLYYARTYKARRGHEDGRGYRDGRWREGRGYRGRRGSDDRRDYSYRDRRAENGPGYPASNIKGPNNRGRGRGYNQYSNGREAGYSGGNQRSNTYAES
ncbi:OTU domain-containing protein 4 [Conger conger]|uniref:OTU domain-containing protein 4 n=1 Tax=Conger conger TaxID=82655 RepID=UPI002A5A16F6|nr:OTU domain-containing protein 4 [Conger conger]